MNVLFLYDLDVGIGDYLGMNFIWFYGEIIGNYIGLQIVMNDSQIGLDELIICYFGNDFGIEIIFNIVLLFFNRIYVVKLVVFKDYCDLSVY